MVYSAAMSGVLEVEVIKFSFSSWLSKANESNKKKDPTDKNLNIKRAPGHYEQKNPFILK